jgi:hemolysin activation/secretion protein
MKLRIISLAVASLFAAHAYAAQEDNKPLSQGQNKQEESLINIKDVEIAGVTGDNAQALKNYAKSKLVGNGAKSIQDIQAVASEMTKVFFKDKGFELSRVYLPVQSLDETNAVLKLSILEGKYGKVTIKGAEGYRAGMIESRLGIASGQQLETKRLERGLLLVDDLPGIKVAGIDAVPGSNTGESDYTINLAKEDKLSFTVLGDNQGNESTGKNRLTARFAIANPTGNGDEIEGGFIHSGNGLTAGQIAYSIPFSIGQSQGWKASVSASKINYRLTQPSVQALDAYGTSEGVSAAITYALVRSQDTNIGFSTQLNYQKLNDYLLGQQFNEKNSKSLAFGFSGDAQRVLFPKLGASYFNWTLANTFGKLDITDAGGRFADSLGPQTQGSFYHLNSSASLNQSLDSISPRLSTYVALSGQYANKNLDSSEKFVVTGPSAVRGYSQGTVSADTGYVMNAEVRYSLPTSSDFTSSVYAFYDYEHGRIYRNSFSSDINSQSVSALGVGITARHKSGVFASVSLSKGHGYENTPGLDKKDNTFAWVQVGYRY